MSMEAAGLFDVWLNQWNADPVYCLNKIEKEINTKKAKKDDKKRLTLKGLSGSFTILGIGWVASTTVFIFEVYKRKRIRNR